MSQGFCVDIVRLIARYLYDWRDLGNFRLASRLCARAIDLTKACPVYYWKQAMDMYAEGYIYVFCWRGRYSYCFNYENGGSMCFFTISRFRIIGNPIRDDYPPWSAVLPYDVYETRYTNSTGEVLNHIERTTAIESEEEEYLTFVLQCTGDYGTSEKDSRICIHVTWYDAIVLELEQFCQWEISTRPSMTSMVPHKRFKIY